MAQIELERTWRVWLKSERYQYRDIVGVKPMVDTNGLLAFADIAGHLVMLFAPGGWLLVEPKDATVGKGVIRFVKKDDGREGEPPVSGEQE